MAARDTYASTLASKHTAAQTGGVASLPGTPTPPGNIASWSRQSASAAANAGSITQAQYVQVINALAGWEESQRDLALDTLRASDTFPA